MYFITSKGKSSVQLLATVAGRAEARTQAKLLGGTVRTESEANALGLHGPVAKPSIMDKAVAIAKAPKARTTVGKAVKVAKRIAATPAALEAGKKAVAAAVKAELNKVGIVHAVARVAGLQRRDVIAIIEAADLGIAVATVSTQFQRVRSGALTK